MPRDETDAVCLAVAQHVFALPVTQVVAVLYGGYLEVTSGSLDLWNAHLAETQQPDEALLLHGAHHVELLVGRYQRVDAMKLPQVDALDTQAPHAQQHAQPQVLWAPDLLPDVGSMTGEAALGRHEHAAVGLVGVAVQHFANQV